MKAAKPEFVTDVEICIDEIIRTVGKKIVFGMPLALGKPNHLANALYLRAKDDPGIDLTILTGLSLEKPRPDSELESRLMGPVIKRIWDEFVEVEYVKDLGEGRLPSNVTISEFFTRAGASLGNAHTQQNYICSNYTHIVRDLIDNGLNVIGNLIAPHPGGRKDIFSTSCNPDLTLELMDRLEAVRASGRTVMAIGQTNGNLPFMHGDAVVDAAFYDYILEVEDTPLFSIPKEAVTPVDHMVGLYVSTLVPDNGTLQIGIGSLGDAVAMGLLMRQNHNGAYTQVLSRMGVRDRYQSLIDRIGGTGRFEKGVYGATEMLVDVFLELYKNKILKRKVYDHEGLQRLLNQGVITEDIPENILDILVDQGLIRPYLNRADFDFLVTHGILKPGFSFGEDTLIYGGGVYPANLDYPKTRDLLNARLGKKLKGGVVCHGAFFIGSQSFYNALNTMEERELKEFSMTSVAHVNQLYGGEDLKALQRREGRFINAGMMVTLLGSVISDALEDGNIISGVGGQYNFVSMAHALEDGRSIIMIRSTRNQGGKVLSNIVFNYGHITIPRHLRDIVVTEYGIADLRGKTDEEIVAALIKVADSRFQEALLAKAKAAGKINVAYEIPEDYRNNTPASIARQLAPFKKQGFFKTFPFGTDFTPEEIVLARSLGGLKKGLKTRKLATALGIVCQFFKRPDPLVLPFLKRMDLDLPQCAKDRFLRAMVSHALMAEKRS